MSDGAEAADCYYEAAELNREDPLLRGSLLDFPDYGQLVMTGDLHGHRRNFDKLKKYCDLEHAGARHVILHELIHEDVQSLDAHDMSHLVLLDAARWKTEFPDQVHFLQSNHELAQLHRSEITKNGRVVAVDFEEGVRETYGKEGGDKVLEAINEFIGTLPLGGRTENGVFLSHSLPAPLAFPAFDPTVFYRVPTVDDLCDYGSAYLLVWGRHQTESQLKKLSEMLNVDYFICGHQPQDMGYEVLHDRMIILASEHNHGVFLPFDLSKEQTLEKLVANIRPFAGVV
jgi:hypothetical protein